MLIGTFNTVKLREDSYPALLSSVHQLDTFHEDCSFEDLLYNIDAAHNDIVKWR